MSRAVIERLVHQLFSRVISAGDLALADAIIADDFVNHDGRSPPGREGFKQGLLAVKAAFPDWISTVDNMVIDGDKVGATWTVRGMQVGPFMGLPPTKRSIIIREAGLLRFANGKLAEIWRTADELALLQQLGALPQLVLAPMHVSDELRTGEGHAHQRDRHPRDGTLGRRRRHQRAFRPRFCQSGCGEGSIPGSSLR